MNLTEQDIQRIADAVYSRVEVRLAELTVSIMDAINEEREGERGDVSKPVSDALRQWLAERCETGEHFKEMSRELFASWRQYAKAVGLDAGSVKAFGESMRKLKFKPFRTRNGRGFAGLRVIPSEPR